MTIPSAPKELPLFGLKNPGGNGNEDIKYSSVTTSKAVNPPLNRYLFCFINFILSSRPFL